MAEMLLEAQATLTQGAPTLQRYVGGQRVVARPNGWIAIDPIARDEVCRVRSDRDPVAPDAFENDGLLR